MTEPEKNAAMPFFQMNGISKRYGGVRALENADLAVRAGRVHAILGENGAGKSTLTKVLAGLYPLTSGEMLVEGAQRSFGSPADALAHGVAMVFQETNLIPSMTVAQNLFLGEESFFNRLRGVNIKAQQQLQRGIAGVDAVQRVQLGRAQHAGQRQCVQQRDEHEGEGNERLHGT